MTPIEQMRSLFLAKRPPNESRFDLYGLFDSRTGELVEAFHSRPEAQSAKAARGDHLLRVQGVPKGMKVPKRLRPKKPKPRPDRRADVTASRDRRLPGKARIRGRRAER